MVTACRSKITALKSIGKFVADTETTQRDFAGSRSWRKLFQLPQSLANRDGRRVDQLEIE